MDSHTHTHLRHREAVLVCCADREGETVVLYMSANQELARVRNFLSVWCFELTHLKYIGPRVHSSQGRVEHTTELGSDQESTEWSTRTMSVGSLVPVLVVLTLLWNLGPSLVCVQYPFCGTSPFSLLHTVDDGD